MKHSRKPWEAHPVQKLWDIACKADHRTKMAIREWMDEYIEKVSVSHKISQHHEEDGLSEDFLAHIKRDMSYSLGSHMAELSADYEEDAGHKDDRGERIIPHREDRMEAYVIALEPKRKRKEKRAE